MTRMNRTIMMGMALLLGVGSEQALRSAEAKEMKVITNLASEWIPLYGETWWDYYHPDYVAFYPGGRSNRFHDLYLSRVRRNQPLTVDWKISNRKYTYDGEWFAVEWFYRATHVEDGFRQWESTLGIGRIKDGRMFSWTEFFDDNVGNLQRIGLMPFFEADEPILPWPRAATLKLPYRP